VNASSLCATPSYVSHSTITQDVSAHIQRELRPYNHLRLEYKVYFCWMSVCLIAAGEAGCKGEREKEDPLVELGIIAHFKSSLLK
jgi:hypothetical protein